MKRIIAAALAASLLSGAVPQMTAAAEADSVLLNEICPKNTTYAAADGGNYDWIELYNSGNSAVDLSGWGLSDNSAKPFKYTFPSGTQIAAGSRLIVFCDSKITEAAGTYAAAFGLSTAGETVVLTKPDGNTADTMTFETLAADTSFGRVPDGSDTLAVMNTVSPNEPNASDDVSIHVDAPVFSKESGFYENNITLSISAPDGTKIYYTTDGSDPDTSSTRYTGEINLSDNSSSPNVLSARTDIQPRVQGMWGIEEAVAPKEPVDKANIIRAVAVDKDGNISSISTGTYFIGYQNKSSYYKDLKVISIVTDPDNLFDYEKGIYVTGKTYDDWRNGAEYDPSVPSYFMPANYTQKGREWEREASMQVFRNGNELLSQNVGIRIHGGATRSQPQKSMNVYARKDYGADSFDYDLFSGNDKDTSGKTIDKFDSFVLRNGGNDCSYARYRDKLNQGLVGDRSFLTQSMESSVVFIDGEYWGQYEITEKVSDDFVHDHYNVPKKNVCIVKNQELDEGDEAGFADFTELWNWIKSTDFSNDTAYQQLCSKVDMQSLADYVSAELYFNNEDWGENNMALWKSMVTDAANPYADGRWRFIMFDTEYSTGLYGRSGASTNSFDKFMSSEGFLSDLFNGALKNEKFKEQFTVTFMDMANENFNTDRIKALIEKYYTDYQNPMIDTYNRFWPSSFGGNQADRTYTSEKSTIQNFYNERPRQVTEHLKRALSLKGEARTLTLKNDTTCGSVKLNTISPTFENGIWQGKYFSDAPLTLTAASKSGYKFSHWELSDGTKLTDPTAELTLSKDMTVTAVYTESDTVIGDINADGSFTVADAVLLNNWLLAVPDTAIADWQAGDLDNNNKLDICDLALMRSRLVK